MKKLSLLCSLFLMVYGCFILLYRLQFEGLPVLILGGLSFYIIAAKTNTVNDLLNIK